MFILIERKTYGEQMHKNTDFIYEAIGKLEELSKMPIKIQSSRELFDVILDIQGTQFYVIAKKNAKNYTYGLILTDLNKVDSSKNVLFIADHISGKLAKQLQENNINYLDAAGNTFIKCQDLFVFIEGQKSILSKKNNQSRLFQETGLKLLLLLISNPVVLEESYRSIAEKADVSLGSVSIVFNELEEQNFLLRSQENKILKNRDELIQRWLIGYNEIIRPKIIRKKMRAVGEESLMERVKESNLKIFFGGELAGQLLTKHLKPQNLVLYSNEDLNLIGKELKLIPDENGNIELRAKFWSDEVPLAGNNLAPKLVVYADLMGTGNNRNIETAQLILEDGI